MFGSIFSNSLIKEISFKSKLKSVFSSTKFLISSLLKENRFLKDINTLKVFDIVWGTTGGGPGLATEALQTYAYRVAYSFLEMSKSMTIMVMFSIVLIILTMIYSKFNKDI